MREHCTGKRRWGRIEKSMGASQGGVLEKGKWAIMRNYCGGFVSKQFLVEGSRSNRRWYLSSALKFKELLWPPRCPTSGLGKRCHDPTPAHWNSLRPTGATVRRIPELWLG
jgi:hypothetical protein